MPDTPQQTVDPTENLSLLILAAKATSGTLTFGNGETVEMAVIHAEIATLDSPEPTAAYLALGRETAVALVRDLSALINDLPALSDQLTDPDTPEDNNQ